MLPENEDPFRVNLQIDRKIDRYSTGRPADSATKGGKYCYLMSVPQRHRSLVRFTLFAFALIQGIQEPCCVVASRLQCFTTCVTDVNLQSPQKVNTNEENCWSWAMMVITSLKAPTLVH